MSGCFNHSGKFPSGNSLFWDKTSTFYLHHTIFMWGKSGKAISSWVHGIRTKRIHVPGRPPFLTLHHPNNLEASTLLTKKSCSSKNCTQLDSLP